ncbi:MAG: hypothetical protein P5702_08610 [Limnospira sp. PMC 1291.21]|uniref:Uncharacterized protein n=2 Tax=Limnospira TaxID=2596745 RepID=A0A9P1P2Q6_9CYAN|nr:MULTISPECIES: hypothetical protein [Limnospira]EKD09196.1 hypothetical protein SPLC1_S205970 [Arthrospira platensis C1]MDC0836698.1 hypothetical protein [Limnoraphis robusta]MDT9177546.1 hypothetical protein [Limnospira sp. PMC 1238.20]MDT9279803.1 hypothetical protein [Limnospira sp. PMC 1293.21]QJB24613.1 hypothetical protein HFV01_00910 [Limnospira fusiformis SAG 85.79]
MAGSLAVSVFYDLLKVASGNADAVQTMPKKIGELKAMLRKAGAALQILKDKEQG